MKLNFAGIDFTQDLSPLINEFLTAADIKKTRENETKTQESDEEMRFITDEEHFEIYFGDELVCSEKLENATGVFRSDYRNQLMRAVYRILSEKLDISLPWGILTGVRPTKLLLDKMEEGKGNDGKASCISFMRNQYYCSEEKAELAYTVAEKEMRILKDLDYARGYSLYVGIPFCPSICNYCSFGSHPIDRYENLVEPYIEALCKEIEATKNLIKDKKLQTVYFGGGTPTAVSADQLRRVIHKVKECFDFSGVREFTVEAGRPDSISMEKLKMLKEEGVGRISVNPQTMRERTLEIIGRKHTAGQTVKAFNMAREAGFDNINMDLIAGLSGENEEDMKYTLSEIEKLNPDSITVHTLALKRAARLNTESENFVGLEASGVGNMVEYAAKYMKAHDYKPYYMYRLKNQTENLENVGYAREGKEGYYNILIMEEKQQILALGAGASSKFVYENKEELDAAKSRMIKRFGRIENVKSVVDYVSRIDEMIERKLNAVK